MVASAAIIWASRSDHRRGIRLIRTALDEGVNFLKCWDYRRRERDSHGQGSRDGYRQKSILMTRSMAATESTRSRRSTIAEAPSDRSCPRFAVSRSHSVIRSRPIFATGARSKLSRSQEGRKNTYIGFTGIKSGYSFEDVKPGLAHHFTFDTVANAAQRDGRSLRQLRTKVLPVLLKQTSESGHETEGDHLFFRATRVHECPIP